MLLCAAIAVAAWLLHPTLRCLRARAELTMAAAAAKALSGACDACGNLDIESWDGGATFHCFGCKNGIPITAGTRIAAERRAMRAVQEFDAADAPTRAVCFFLHENEHFECARLIFRCARKKGERRKAAIGRRDAWLFKIIPGHARLFHKTDIRGLTSHGPNVRGTHAHARHVLNDILAHAAPIPCHCTRPSR